MYSGNHPVDFFVCRVACTTGADQAVGGEAKAVDDRGGVEVAVREVKGALGESAGDFGGRDAGDGECDGGRARGVGRWAVEGDARVRGEGLPEVRGEDCGALVELGEGGAKPQAAISRSCLPSGTW